MDDLITYANTLSITANQSLWTMDKNIKSDQYLSVQALYFADSL